MGPGSVIYDKYGIKITRSILGCLFILKEVVSRLVKIMLSLSELFNFMFVICIIKSIGKLIPSSILILTPWIGPTCDQFWVICINCICDLRVVWRKHKVKGNYSLTPIIRVILFSLILYILLFSWLEVIGLFDYCLIN